jgi:hypothetical protein
VTLPRGSWPIQRLGTIPRFYSGCTVNDRSGSFSDLGSDLIDFRFPPDCVAKVVLQEMSKILRAAGAFFV